MKKIFLAIFSVLLFFSVSHADLIRRAETDPQVGAVTSGKGCEGDGSAVQCDLTLDGSGSCASGSICSGGHTHPASEISDFGSQTAATFYSAPTATSGPPSFRAIAAGDLPDLTKTYQKDLSIPIASESTAVATGDAQVCYAVPASLNGFKINTVGAHVYTVSSSGTPTFMLHKKLLSDNSLVDILSTALTIDASERDSSSAATAAVINTSNNSVATGDEVCVDVDTAGTGTTGAEIRLSFIKP